MKIICIGKNYLNHVKEFDGIKPESPVVFMKPDTSIVKNNNPFYHPDFSSNIHHEVELIIRISKEGKNIQEKFAHKYYNQYGLGIDFTARDVQTDLKKKGLPWEKAKSFDGSAPVSSFIDINEPCDIQNISFSLKKNGIIVQSGNTKDMIFNINQIISYVSSFILLKTGDVIFTGTPEGVGKVEVGDQLEGFIGTQKVIDIPIK